MFGIVLTFAFTILLSYILLRVASVPALKNRFSRKKIAICGASVWLMFFLGRFIGHDGTGPVATTLEFMGMTLLGTVFITSTVLLIVDLGTVFGWVFKKWAPRIRGYALAAGALLSVFALMQGLRPPAVVSHVVTLPGLPAELDGRVLVALSDTHLGSQTGPEWFTERLKETQALNPDVIVFLGDMFEGHGEPIDDIPALSDLRPTLGKWFVNGNHESHGDGGGGDALLKQGGFRRLANQWVELAPGLVLAGVNDLTNHKRRKRSGDPVARALAKRPKGATILLSHTPWQIEQAADAGVELMLSGHTHGGQIWPFGYVVQTLYPLLAGRYEIEGMTVIVSRGTGTWGPPMRLWHRGEITKVILRSK